MSLCSVKTIRVVYLTPVSKDSRLEPAAAGGLSVGLCLNESAYLLDTIRLHCGNSTHLVELMCSPAVSRSQPCCYLHPTAFACRMFVFDR